MNESFVFHADFIENIPEELKKDWLMHIINYGIYGSIPELNNFELIYWKTIQKRIDMDKANYEITCLKQKINAINVRVRNNKASDNDLTNLESFKTKLNELNELKKNNSFNTKLNKLNEQNEVKRTHHDIEFDIDIDNEFDTDIEFDIDIDAAKLPDKNLPSQKVFSDKLFNILKSANLPCCRGNDVTFYMSDYANAMRYLHSSPDYKTLHTDDIIGAVENYIKALNDPDRFISSKMNLYSLVKSKLFYNLLPSNFSDDSFRNYGLADKPKEEEIHKVFISYPCLDCGTKTLYQIRDHYHCDKCGKDWTAMEVIK